MPPSVKLVLGNKNYSSWSLRAWLALRKSGHPFEELVLPLDTPEFAAAIGDYSPAGRVPVLWHGELCVWDSLAICEYVNEQFAAGQLWPGDPATRARGRSLAAEMHAGFACLRAEMPMNIRARREVPLTPGLGRDLQRLFEMWSSSREQYRADGAWLLGQFSIADAMFAPVLMRLLTYGVRLPPAVAEYVDTVRNDPDMADWIAAAQAESWVVAADEAGVEGPGD